MNPEWEKKRIGEIAELGSGGTPSRSDMARYYADGTIWWVKTGDLNNETIVETEEKITEIALSESSCRVYPIGTVLVAMYGGFKQIGRTGLLNISAAVNQALTAIRVDTNKVCPEYLQHWLNCHVDIWKKLAGSSRKDPNITKAEVAAFPIVLPRLNEQQAIANVISGWDRAIRPAMDLIAAKSHFKQGLIQQLLSGKLHFGMEDPEFQLVTIGEIVEKVVSAVNVDANTQYREIGIRSYGKGIFHKEPVLGAVLGDKRVYEVEPGCLTVNIVFAWEQAVAVTTPAEKGFIASHRFPMFKPDTTRAEARYLLRYFLSPVGSEALQLASPGGAGRNRTMSQSAFLKLKLPLPSIRFQQQFVSLVENLDSELSLLTQQLAFLKTQKKGLMRKLLTGEVRVKVPS